jgi:hypothetical protein
MGNDQIKYDLFISYARKDARANTEYESTWIRILCNFLREDFFEHSSSELNIFLDENEIRDMDDWRHRIQGALRSSKVLVICFSPNYLESMNCQWEWDDYQIKRSRDLIGFDSIVVLYLHSVPTPTQPKQKSWVEEINRSQRTDIRDWLSKNHVQPSMNRLREISAICTADLLTS